jgi:hypothetical protein
MTQTQVNTESIFKSQLLTDTAEMIKAAGLTVYYSVWKHSSEKPTYFYFTDGKNIGYCQEDYFGGIKFSTVHIPCRNCGTGFGLNEDGLFNPTIEDAKRAFIIAPHWANRNDVQSVKKYESWQQYISKPLNNMCEHIQY